MSVSQQQQQFGGSSDALRSLIHGRASIAVCTGAGGSDGGSDDDDLRRGRARARGDVLERWTFRLSRQRQRQRQRQRKGRASCREIDKGRSLWVDEKFVRRYFATLRATPSGRRTTHNSSALCRKPTTPALIQRKPTPPFGQPAWPRGLVVPLSGSSTEPGDTLRKVRGFCRLHPE